MHSKDAKCDFAAQGPVTFTGSTDPTRLNCSRAASIQSGCITRRAPYRNYVQSQHYHDQEIHPQCKAVVHLGKGTMLGDPKLSIPRNHSAVWKRRARVPSLEVEQAQYRALLSPKYSIPKMPPYRWKAMRKSKKEIYSPPRMMRSLLMEPSMRPMPLVSNYQTPLKSSQLK